MSTASNCDCLCPTPEITEVPGSAGTNGADGAAGAAGVSAFTTLTSDLTLPAVNANVTALVVSSAMLAVGQKVFSGDGTDEGTFSVVSLPSAASVELQFLGYADDSAPGAIIASGSKVVPAGTQPPLSAALPTALTDNSTGTASNTIAAGTGVTTLTFHINLAALTAAAADLLTAYTLGYAFKILSVNFVVTTLGVGAGATMTLNLEIGATNVTGGVVNPTEANTATLGAIVAGTAVTAANVGTNTDTLSIEVAAGGTIFTAGQGTLLVKVQNMDSANAVASLADHVNDLITAISRNYLRLGFLD